MPHGGYHGTVKMGGKTIQQGYQDNSGNYQIRGGIDDNSRLDKNPPRNVQPAQLPNIPDNLITNEMRLQNIIDNKDIFKNQPSPTRPGMNVYQDRMQDFRTSTPEAMQTYANRFPLTQFAMTGLPRIAMSMIPGGNVFSAIANAYQSGKGKVQGGLSSIADEFSGTLAGLKSLLPTSVGGANVPDVSTPIKFIDESRPEDYPLRDMAVDQTPLSNFFKIPMYTQNYAEQQAGPNPTYVDPREIREFLNPNKKFNEGGLASLNNPEYGMLMKASDFSL
jgi:hypothetical protein